MLQIREEFLVQKTVIRWVSKGLNLIRVLLKYKNMCQIKVEHEVFN